MLHPPPWDQIDDDELVRELEQAHTHRHQTFLAGSAAALAHLGERTTQLEAEFLRRFPDRVTDADDKSGLYGS